MAQQSGEQEGPFLQVEAPPCPGRDRQGWQAIAFCASEADHRVPSEWTSSASQEDDTMSGPCFSQSRRQHNDRVPPSPPLRGLLAYGNIGTRTLMPILPTEVCACATPTSTLEVNDVACVDPPLRVNPCAIPAVILPFTLRTAPSEHCGKGPGHSPWMLSTKDMAAPSSACLIL